MSPNAKWLVSHPEWQESTKWGSGQLPKRDLCYYRESKQQQSNVILSARLTFLSELFAWLHVWNLQQINLVVIHFALDKLLLPQKRLCIHHFPFVGLFICQQDCTKSTELICSKHTVGRGHEPLKNLLYFGEETVKGAGHFLIQQKYALYWVPV